MSILEHTLILNCAIARGPSMEDLVFYTFFAVCDIYIHLISHLTSFQIIFCCSSTKLLYSMEYVYDPVGQLKQIEGTQIALLDTHFSKEGHGLYDRACVVAIA